MVCLFLVFRHLPRSRLVLGLWFISLCSGYFVAACVRSFSGPWFVVVISAARLFRVNSVVVYITSLSLCDMVAVCCLFVRCHRLWSRACCVLPGGCIVLSLRVFL